jgi:hypothetical protein
VTDSVDVLVYKGLIPTLRLTVEGSADRPTRAATEEWQKAVRGEYGEVGGSIVKALEHAPEAGGLPMVGALVVDDQRNVWVGEYITPGEHQRRWTILSTSGVPLGTILLPAAPEALLPGRSEILDVYGDRLALLRVGEDGELSIEVRQIEHR